MDNREETLKRLNQISPAFCPVKWKHSTINLADGTVKSCCHQEMRTWEDSVQFHDTKQDQIEREQMLKGQFPKNCEFCSRFESQNKMSDRVLWSEKPWIKPSLDEFEVKVSSELTNPTWVELNFSNTCNLKCSYCSGIFSSSWQNEIEKDGPYPDQVAFNYKNFTGNKNSKDLAHMKEKFWPWFKESYSSIRFLKITGGEPLFSPDTEVVLDWIEQNPNPQLVLSVNSNLSIPSSRWRTFVDRVDLLIKQKKILKFSLHPSIDTYGPQAEYIRFGLNFELFKENLEYYLEKTKSEVVIISTLNCLSLFKLQELWSYILKLKQRHGPARSLIVIKTKILMLPPWQEIGLLPPRYSKYLKKTLKFINNNLGDRYTHFTDEDAKGIQIAIDLIESKSKESKSFEQKRFVIFFQEHDKRRKTSLWKTFPEMRLFWLQCYLKTKIFKPKTEILSV